MNGTELELARQNYLLNKKSENLLEKINSELVVLKEDKNVKRYIELINEIKNYNCELSMYNLSNKDKNTEKSKNIYVFLGYYNMYSSGVIIPLYESNPYSRHICYANLETVEITIIDRDLKQNFEKENIVVYFDDSKQYHPFKFYQEKFNELRNKYFSYLVNKEQDVSNKQKIKKG